jgi:DNA helicase-2/ATP-dependent DNA helicase PcrA
MSHTWSPQQAAFLDWAVNGSGSCILIAVAGAGKTTVMLEAGVRMPGDVLYVAYNKDVADETQAKLKKMGVDWKKMRASTVHSAGFSMIRKASPGVQVDGNKARHIFDRCASETLQPRMGEVLKLVSLAKQSAFGTAGPSIEDDGAWLDLGEHYDVFDDYASTDARLPMVKLAQTILAESNADLETVDYDDMVYLPVLHQLPCWRHAVVMVDEAQDTNAARRALIRVLLRKGGRLIAVGDPAQAIYGFTGADSNSLDLIAKDFNAARLPLTITYRCPKQVVAVAQQWVSHISAADTAPEGEVTQIAYEAFLERNDLTGSAAVLCRLNKPLVSLAFALLRRRIPCKIAGREDVGAGLKKLLTRWKLTGLDALEHKLDEYLARTTTKLLAKKQEARIAAVEDQVETAKVIIQATRESKQYTVAAAVAWIDGMFTDERYLSGMLLLSSIHKSKGREWEHVYWLDQAGTCPNKWARQDWQIEQEKNLQYVCATRAKQCLTDIIVEPKKETER